MTPIRPCSLWRFKADGLIHRVIFCKPDEVTTVSPTCAWLGPAEDFREQFTPLPEPDSK